MSKTIGEFCQVFAGSSAPQDKAVFVSEGIPFVRAGSLQHLCSGGSLDDCEQINREIGTKLKLRLAPAGTILFAKSGMSAMKDRVYCLPREAYVVSHLAGLIPSESVDSRYLTYWFRVNPPSRLINDPAYPSIRLSDISKVKFDPPSLNEQKRIAAILDKTNNIFRQSDYTLKIRATLIRAVFFEMFGDPASNQNQFPIKPLSECILEIRTGKSLGKEDRELQPNEWGVLKTSAVTWGTFDPTQYKAVPDADLSKYEQPSIGDLLFTRNNTWELVGATCVVHKKTENLILPDRIWNIVPNPGIANTTFLHYLFKHPYIHALIANAASGTSGSMLNISQPKLKGVKTIIPPISLQNLFRQRVVQINSLFEKIEDANILSSTKSKAIIQEMLT